MYLYMVCNVHLVHLYFLYLPLCIKTNYNNIITNVVIGVKYTNPAIIEILVWILINIVLTCTPSS